MRIFVCVWVYLTNEIIIQIIQSEVDTGRKFHQSLLLNYPSVASELDAEHEIAQAIILVMHDPNAIKATILLVEKMTDRSFTVVCGCEWYSHCVFRAIRG